MKIVNFIGMLISSEGYLYEMENLGEMKFPTDDRFLPKTQNRWSAWLFGSGPSFLKNNIK